MKKILTLALVSVVTLALTTGCSSKSANPEEHGSKDALIIEKQSSSKTISAIEKAGKEANWKITKFKSNEVVAEKLGNGVTASTSILIHEGYLEFSNNSETSDLRSAIKDELKNQNKAH